MPIIPFRDIGASGIVRDLKSYNLPFPAWDDGRNIQFKNGTVARYPVLKLGSDTFTVPASPIGTFSSSISKTQDRFVIVTADTELFEFNGTTLSDVTPSDSALAVTSQNRVSNCVLGDVIYCNRQSTPPLYRSASSGPLFAAIPNWETDDRCAVLRAFKDFLIALNVTKGSTEFSTMVKFSDAAQVGVPPDWDPTAIGTLAGENILSEATSPIVDGLDSRNAFYIYTSTEVFVMVFIGGDFVFQFEKVFDDAGMIAQDCAVNLDNRQVVFGPEDIYMHDGIQKTSIISGRNKEYLYESIDFTKADRCFVTHRPEDEEIIFAYPSRDSAVAWQDTDYCNAAAVYNYARNVWTFIDLPNAVGATRGIFSTGSNWDSETGQWVATSTTWANQSSRGVTFHLLLSAGFGSEFDPEVYILDDYKDGVSTKPVVTELIWPAFVKRSKIDLDQIGATLRGRKCLKTIYPQAEIDNEDGVLNFGFGTSNFTDEVGAISLLRPFDPTKQYKLDARKAGRYLTMSIEFPAGTSGEVAGFDLDIMIIAQR